MIHRNAAEVRFFCEFGARVIMDPLSISNVSSRDVTLPALIPPPGVTSDFVNPETRASALVITSTICITLVVLCVAVRFYTKIHIKHAWGLDDCTSLLILPMRDVNTT